MNSCALPKYNNVVASTCKGKYKCFTSEVDNGNIGVVTGHNIARDSETTTSQCQRGYIHV